MRRVSMTTRDELLGAVAARYRSSVRSEKTRILDEFAAVTGYHRKHAMRLLRAGLFDRRSASRPQRRLYDEAVREALIVLWEASDRICGKRLKAHPDPCLGHGAPRPPFPRTRNPHRAPRDQRGHDRPCPALSARPGWRRFAPTGNVLGHPPLDPSAHPSPTGATHHPASSRPTLLPIPVRSPPAPSCRRWSSPTWPPAGPSARRC
jgi:hypothetical protein